MSKSITHSSMSDAKTCMRKFYFSYELGIEKERKSEALRIGNEVHKGLDLLAQGVDLLDATAAIRMDYATIPAWCSTHEDMHDWMTQCETVVRLIEAYANIYAYDTAIIIGTETEFEVPIINPETGHAATSTSRRGKIDKIIRLSDGRLAIREHKTTSDDISPGSDYWACLCIDQQISGYMVAARQLGYDVRTVEYDVIRKPGIAPRQLSRLSKDERWELDRGFYFGEQFTLHHLSNAITANIESPEMYGARLADELMSKPERYFQRREIPRLDSDLDEFAAEIWQIHQLILSARKRGWWFKNTQACLHKYRCEFCELCFAGINPTESLPSGYRIKDRIHPELGENNGSTTHETASPATETSSDIVEIF